MMRIGSLPRVGKLDWVSPREEFQQDACDCSQYLLSQQVGVLFRLLQN